MKTIKTLFLAIAMLLGAAVSIRAELPNVRLQDINGKTVQEGMTADMVFKIDEIVSYISRFFTLKTGDIIYTGTPAGIGPVHIDDHLEGYIEDRKVLEFNCK